MTVLIILICLLVYIVATFLFRLSGRVSRKLLRQSSASSLVFVSFVAALLGLVPLLLMLMATGIYAFVLYSPTHCGGKWMPSPCTRLSVAATSAAFVAFMSWPILLVTETACIVGAICEWRRTRNRSDIDVSGES